MTIEIRPETEELVKEELQNGHFGSVDELIVSGIQALREKVAEESGQAANLSLEEVFAQVRGLADDLDFSRNPSTGRPVDL